MRLRLAGVTSVLILGSVLLAASAGGAAGETKLVVSFRFTSVSGKRPPNIVEIRRVGQGRLTFDRVPAAGGATGLAVRGEGTVVYEADVLTPHPSTEELRFKVVGGTYTQKQDASGAVAEQSVTAHVDVVSSTLAACREAEGAVRLRVSTTQRVVAIDIPCGGESVREGQSAGTGKNSRIQITITPTCVRTTQGAGARPLCGAPDPVVGVWTWKFAPPGQTIEAHGTVTFSSDGTMSWSGGNSGTWKHTGSSVTLSWTGGDKTVDRLTLSSDGTALTGSNSAGWSVQGAKR